MGCEDEAMRWLFAEGFDFFLWSKLLSAWTNQPTSARLHDRSSSEQFLHIFWVSIFSKLSRPLEPQLLFGSLSTQKPPGRWDTRWRLLMAVWKGICKGYGSKRKGLGTTAFGVFFLLPTGFCRYIIIPFWPVAISHGHAPCDWLGWLTCLVLGGAHSVSHGTKKPLPKGIPQRILIFDIGFSNGTPAQQPRGTYDRRRLVIWAKTSFSLSWQQK